MKISYITPTHAVEGTPEFRYLMEAYTSLLDQNNGNWEWVVCPNGPAVDYDFSKIFKDPRARICPTKLTGNIGELKKFACAQAKGEVCAEFDHDDLLMPNCTEQLLSAFRDPEVVFAYSNCAEFYYGHPSQKDHTPVIFNHAHGWQYNDFEYQGHTYKEAISFTMSPASLRLIYYAPNHIRAWKSCTYWDIGGHDPKLNVIDDHDLCVRFYLHGKTVKINKCLYLYRVHGNNSWIKYNADVQRLTHELHTRYMSDLVVAWGKKSGAPMLDLGGRFNAASGFQTADIKPPATWVADLSKPWQWPDNTFSVIRAYDFLEHIKDQQHVMSEIHRVLVPGGFLMSSTPSTDGRGAFQDPTHVSFWNENSFWYWTRHTHAKYIDNNTARFQEIELRTTQGAIPYVKFVGAALKDGSPRYPGLIYF